MYLFTIVLNVAVYVALVVMVISVIGLCLRWHTAHWRGHFIRLVIATAAIPCLFAIHFAHLHWIVIPETGRVRREQIELSREKFTKIHIGESVPAFSIQSTDGDQFSMPNPGKIVLINFFATWCGPCRLELPHLQEIWLENQSDENFELLVIGREETPDAVRQFRDEHKYSFPFAADPSGEVYSLFAEKFIPRTLLISSDGEVLFSSIGFHEHELGELRVVLQDELSKLRVGR